VLVVIEILGVAFALWHTAVPHDVGNPPRHFNPTGWHNLPPFACRRAFCGSSILLIPSKIVPLWERDSEERGARRGRRCKEQLGVLGAPARLCFINPASALPKDWASRASLPSLIFIAAGIEAMCGKMWVDVEFVPLCGVKRT